MGRGPQGLRTQGHRGQEQGRPDQGRPPDHQGHGRPVEVLLALAKGDAGRKVEAVAELRALLADLPAGDERRGAVEASIARILGQPAPAARDPQQQAMIQGMVDGLAAKLEANPDDADGWVRLVRAYAVLGDTRKRDAAYASARARYAGQPQVVQQLDEAARAAPQGSTE